MRKSMEPALRAFYMKQMEQFFIYEGKVKVFWIYYNFFRTIDLLVDKTFYLF